MEHKVYAILVEQDDIGWKTLLFDLIKKDEMDPWDIDISQLTKRYIQTLKDMKDKDLKLSGKILLAAAILLRIKSKRLVGEDLNEFDRLIAASQEELSGDGDLASGIVGEEGVNISVLTNEGKDGEPTLIPHTPLPRKRKVSVYDLVHALEKALEVKHRRLLKQSIPEVLLPRPEEQFDITLVMKRLFVRIKEFFLFSKGKTLSWDQTLPQEVSRKEKVRQFIALLHLATTQKVRIAQSEAFGKIDIKINHDAPTEGEQKKLV